jgi:addiction module RelE/StbE family toxin
MAKRKIVWSNRAKIKLYEILKFYNERNNSNKYSEKLYRRFTKELKILLKHHQIGTKTEIKSVRRYIISDFLFFYEITDDLIIIHIIWDSNQNPENLNLKNLK